jgi:hypothetical protein
VPGACQFAKRKEIRLLQPTLCKIQRLTRRVRRLSCTSISGLARHRHFTEFGTIFA